MVFVEQLAVGVIDRGDAVLCVAVVLGDQGEQDFFGVALALFDAARAFELDEARAARAEHSCNSAFA